MSNPTPNREPPVHAPRARPGLLTEDRNAAVVTASDGTQRIVKVPSRAEEAARQGVSESAI